MISIVFISLAAIFNALMDSTENEHFFDTIFRGLPQRFWYKRQSWNIAKKIFKWKFDAWHTAKSCMILMIVLAVLTYKPTFKGFLINGYIVHVLDFIVAGAVWNGVFNLFYNRVFSKKKK